MSKQVLVTGGAGFIGSHVACELRRWGYAVYHSGTAPSASSMCSALVKRFPTFAPPCWRSLPRAT